MNKTYTIKDWMFTELTSKQLANVIINLLPKIGRSYSDSVGGVEEFLDEEYNKLPTAYIEILSQYKEV